MIKGRIKRKRKDAVSPTKDYHGVTTPTSMLALQTAQNILPQTKQALWRKIQDEVSARFTNYSLRIFGKEFNGSKNDEKMKLPLLRRICQKLGIRIQSRNFNFALSEPIEAADIVDFIPVIKHGFPKSPQPEIYQLLEVGRIQMEQLRCKESLDVLQEALMLLYQTVGVLHDDVASCCQMISTCLFREGDIDGAIVQQQRAILIYKQLHGHDSSYVVLGYEHLAVLYRQKLEHDMAINYRLK